MEMTTMQTRLPTKLRMTTAELRKELAAAKPSKYLNKKIEVDGRWFHSQKEAARYGELKLMQKVGEISRLECQPRYALVVNGRRVCGYIGDFSYVTRAGVVVTEDVKSEYTAHLNEFRIKAKLFRAVFGYDITIVGA